MNTNKISSRQLRKIIIEQSKRAGVGHIGSALCIAEILSVLYERILRETDCFILSKGHAALGLYAVLYLAGKISTEILETYCGDNSFLGVHPEHFIKGIDFATGSLGQGLSYGVGYALAARLKSSDQKVYVLVSDAECNEGSIWESVMFAAQQMLSNLVLIIDDNKQQALDYTKNIISLHPLATRFAAFNWDVVEVDGHDEVALGEALCNTSSRPRAVVAHTVFGKGVSFMESKIEWHYFSMSDSFYEQAIAELGNTP